MPTRSFPDDPRRRGLVIIERKDDGYTYALGYNQAPPARARVFVWVRQEHWVLSQRYET